MFTQFITLTNRTTKTLIAVQVNDISTFEESYNGSTVFLKSGRRLDVCELYEDILRLIEDDDDDDDEWDEEEDEDEDK